MMQFPVSLANVSLWGILMLFPFYVRFSYDSVHLC